MHRGIRGLPVEGSVLTISFRPIPFLPFRVRSEAQIVAFAMNQFFEDAHSDRLFKSWHHRHEFAAEDRAGVSGTLVRDIVTYELGFGPLSSPVNTLSVSPDAPHVWIPPASGRAVPDPPVNLVSGNQIGNPECLKELTSRSKLVPI